jgi:hypothetical protein
MMLRPWHAVVFALALAAFAIALAPASAFLNPVQGTVSFSRADGSIWSPTLRDVTFGELRAGDVRLRIDPLALLRLTLAVDAVFDGPDVKGGVSIERNSGVRLSSKALTLIGMPLLGEGRAPGETRLSDVDVTLSPETCTAATGKTTSDAFVEPLRTVTGAPGPVLSGPIACVDRAARFTLSGERDANALEAFLDLRGDGRGDWRVTVSSPDQMRAAAFAAYGLTPNGRGGFERTGTLTWLAF